MKTMFRALWRSRRAPTALDVLGQANRARNEGRFEDAAALVARGLALDPRNIVGHVLDGQLHLIFRELPAAKDAFTRALSLDGYHPRALLGLARIAFEERDADRCHQLLARALEMYPDFPEAQALLDATAPAPPPAMAPARAPVAARDGDVVLAPGDGKRDGTDFSRVVRLGAALLSCGGCGALSGARIQGDEAGPRPATGRAAFDGRDFRALLGVLGGLAGVRGTLVVGLDGLVIAAQLPPRVAAEPLSAVAATLGRELELVSEQRRARVFTVAAFSGADGTIFLGGTPIGFVVILVATDAAGDALRERFAAVVDHVRVAWTAH